MKCKEEKGAKMEQSDLEMQPLQRGEGHQKRDYWDNVFHKLAEADGDEVDAVRTGGVPTIHIRKLKKYLKDAKSLQVEMNEETDDIYNSSNIGVINSR